MDDVPDLGPMPQRVIISAAQARRLVVEQFPQWAADAINARRMLAEIVAEHG